LREQALSFWQEGFHESNSQDAFRTLLGEMIGLGVLRLTGDGHYALRSPNVIQLLGNDNQILDKLNEDRERPKGYDAATFRSRITDSGGMWRSPITAHQWSVLGGPRSGASILLGCGPASFDDVGRYLHDAFGILYRPLEGVRHLKDFSAQLTAIARTPQPGTTVVFVSATYNAWDGAWVEMAEKVVRDHSTRTAFMRVVFAANPDTAWNLVVSGTVDFDDALVLAPWADAAVRQLIEEDTDLRGIDRRTRAEIIYGATGNWSMLLRAFYDRAIADPDHWQEHIAAVRSELSDSVRAATLAEGFGLGIPGAWAVLSVVALLDEPDGVLVEEVGDMVDGVDAETVRQCLRWADLLRLASPGGNGRWKLNPAVRTVIQALDAAGHAAVASS